MSRTEGNVMNESLTQINAVEGNRTEQPELGHHARIQRQQAQLRQERAAAARNAATKEEFERLGWVWEAFEAADEAGRAAVVAYVAIGAFAALGVIEAVVHTWHLLAGLTLAHLVVLAVQAAVFGGGGALWVWVRGGKRSAA